MKHLVALSGGKDSTALAVRLAEIGEHDYDFAITPTGRELPEMNAHWARLECLLKKPLLRIPAPTLVQLIVKHKTLPNWRMRFCTRQVKIEPYIEYATANAPAICYVGIRADEVAGQDAREGTNWSGIENVTQDLPLVWWGWGINRVREYLREKSIEVPERTDCDFCFFQRIGEWWRLWKNHLDRWMEAEALEMFTGHTFRSDQRDSWPASLRELRAMFERGYVPKGAAQTNLPIDVQTRPTMCAWCAR